MAPAGVMQAPGSVAADDRFARAEGAEPTIGMATDRSSALATEGQRRYQVCAAARTSTSFTATRRSRVTM